MELIALLSHRETKVIAPVKEVLGRHTVYPLRTLEELEELNRNMPLNLILVDSASHSISLIKNFLLQLDSNMVILLSSDNDDKLPVDRTPLSIFMSISVDRIKAELSIAVERALEERRFVSDLKSLENSVEYSESSPGSFLNRPETDGLSAGRYLHQKVLVNFAKILTAGFDINKLSDHFMDSVMEITRVSRMSVLIREKEGFKVKAQYGFASYIADNLRFGNESAIVRWLEKTGRIIRKGIQQNDSLSVRLAKDLDLIHASFAFPLVCKGRLIGIFSLSGKITGESFRDEELEIIYVLCQYLAAAVKDIDLYRQMRYQKEFTKNMLSSMNSAIISIDRDKKITIFNKLASEILDMKESEMLDADLKSLPSPLGDILYETMVTGTSYKRYEVRILDTKVPVGINSYRLLDEQQIPIGAGIVFTDLSDSKKLEEQMMRTEKLEAVNDLMAKIAHEVRNPLTSIQTYVQLLHEKYGDDDELGSFYTSSVNQSIRRLDGLIEKLLTFSVAEEYDYEKVDLQSVVESAFKYIQKHIPSGYTCRKGEADESGCIRADRDALVKAIYHIILGIVEITPEGTLIYLNTRRARRGEDSVEIKIRFDGKKFNERERKNLLRPVLEIDSLSTELNFQIGRKIIEAHHGNFDIQSEHEGNAFIIKLPVIEERTSAAGIEKGEYDDRPIKDTYN